MNWIKGTISVVIAVAMSASAMAQTGYEQGANSASAPVSQLPVYVTPSWVTTGNLPAYDVPQTQATPNYFVLSFVIPAPEIIKERREVMTSNLAFDGKSTRLDACYGDNAGKLIQIERTIDKIKNNRNLVITGIRIIGYSSIEGYTDDNTRLAQQRAAVLGNYFEKFYGYPVSYHWRGEDWTGLINMVANSNLPDKYQVINIINTTEDVNLRKYRLRQLSGGNTYRTMQRDFFPYLHKTEYSIAYEVKNFDTAESQIALDSDPSLLSLNELYSLAASYSVGSREFLKVFDIALRLYPTDIVSTINNAALDIIDGAYDRAINILQYISQSEAVNNLGVACARKGDMPRATYYFNLAAGQGNADAEKNLRLARHWGF